MEREIKNPNRRQFLAALGSAAAGVALSAHGTAVSAAAKSARPNFVFIFADDLGWGDLGCYGNRQIKTPNLDELARKGMLFTQFYVNGSVCSPSRTAFMTGHFPARHGVHGHFAAHSQNKARAMPNWLDPKVHTVTRLLRDSGYVTGHFGKWHLGSGDGAPTPGDYGIDDHATRSSSGPQLTETDEANYRRLREMVAMIPTEDRLMASNRVGPHVSNRPHVFFYREWRDADWVLVDDKDLDKAAKQRHDDRIRKGKLKLVKSWRRLKLFQVQRVKK